MLWTQTMDERGQNRAHSQVNSSRGGILSGFSPNESVPILPLTPQIRITAKKQIWGAQHQQLERNLHSWQGSDNHRTKRKPCSISRADSDQHNTNQTPYRGDNSTNLWTKLTHQRSDTRSKRNYDPAACGKETTNKVSETKWDNREICCRQRSKIKNYRNN